MRVENTTSYSPGASQRMSSGGIDQLPRGGELGLAAVELPVELAPAELFEDLPHPRGLGQTEIREVGAADLEGHLAQPAEVLVQRLQLVERERKERSVGGVGLREHDDLGRRQLAGAEPLH